MTPALVGTTFWPLGGTMSESSRRAARRRSPAHGGPGGGHAGFQGGIGRNDFPHEMLGPGLELVLVHGELPEKGRLGDSRSFASARCSSY